MELINESILEYCEAHSSAQSDLLKWLERETHLKVNKPRMLSGHLQGRLLSFLSRLIAPSAVLEIGTYTGYSALCLAEGLSAGGTLHTIDPNAETNHFARQVFARSAYAGSIFLHEGQAADIIPALTQVFDLVFIDADKKSYSQYFDLVVDKVRPGGLIVADNVLWSGKVIEQQPDKDTLLIQEFNRKIQQENRVEHVMLPLRDGLTLMRRL